MSATIAPDYVATTLDQAEKFRTEIVGSASRGLNLAAGAVNSAAKQVKHDLQSLVDVSFTTAEKLLGRGRAFANNLVAATDRIGR
jgi:hypothetical protein